jgi:hypothetical protein
MYIFLIYTFQISFYPWTLNVEYLNFLAVWTKFDTLFPNIFLKEKEETPDQRKLLSLQSSQYSSTFKVQGYVSSVLIS